MRLLKQITNAVRLIFLSPYFGFIQGHSHLLLKDIQKIRSLVGEDSDEIIRNYEKKFAELVGPGEAVSYAAARMGFYELMRIQGVGIGDEVILLGATCAVMVNAVRRTGATAVFSDIDHETFGSSCQAIEVCITPKTRMIVAQHSFGIPTKISFTKMEAAVY